MQLEEIEEKLKRTKSILFGSSTSSRATWKRPQDEAIKKAEAKGLFRPLSLSWLWKGKTRQGWVKGSGLTSLDAFGLDFSCMAPDPGMVKVEEAQLWTGQVAFQRPAHNGALCF